MHPRLQSLLATRFAEFGDGTALDLATGARVWIERRTLDPVGRLAWPATVARLAGLWHSAIAPCLDFGWATSHEWFEAYAMQPADLAQARTAHAFLAAHAVDCSLVRRSRGRPPAWVVPAPPGDEHALPAAVQPAQGLGIQLVPRRLEAHIVAALSEGRIGGPIVWSIEAPFGSGWRTTWRRLAREARLAGYVPVQAHVLETPAGAGHPSPGSWLGVLSGTALLVVSEQADWQPARRRQLARLLVRLGGLDAVSIIVLDVMRGERPRRAAHRLAPFDPDTLAAALWVPPGCSPHWLRARRTAEVTGGMPGPFLEAIAQRLGVRPTPPTVHERPSGFEARAGGEPARAASAAMRRAATLVGRGRAAEADRHLARTASALGRRGQRAGQTQLLAARAEGLAARGELARSRALWLEAAGRAEPDAIPALVDVAARVAGQWLRQGALVEAERALLAAAAAARALGLPAPAPLVMTLVHARCWQARWHDALAAAALVEDGLPVSRVWPRLELGDIAGATADLRAARHGAAPADPRLVDTAQLRTDIALGEVERLHAFPDPPAVDDWAGDDLALLPLEGLVRAGAPLTEPMRARLRTLTRACCPRLVRARARLALAVAACQAPPAVLIADLARVVRATRARALACGASRIACWRQTSPEATPMLTDLIAVLRTCQAHDDPRTALEHVARQLRERLRADGVAVFGVRERVGLVLAVAGPHDLSSVGRRVCDAGTAVGDDQPGVRDASAVIRMGDTVVGALAVRWVMPDAGSGADAPALLEAVATAVAPSVRLAVELAPAVSLPAPAPALLGVSGAMARVRAAVETAARVPFTVLVEGESGSGKELVAREIHRLGPRRARSFCAVNCAALTDELCESELFGHARGAFTGAVAERPGLFEEADGGTLFLDEVSELSPRAQAKLLRAIQEGEIRRLGETRPRRVDVRLVAATNRALLDAVAAGAFRADLRYRLDVIHITLPPLRDRPEDVPLLVQQFWQKAADRVGSRAQLAAETVAALARYHWPGNVRELQNVLSALAAQAPRRGVVRPSALTPAVGSRARPAVLTLEQARRMTDERLVREALAHSGGHRGRAASALGLTRQGLAKLVDRLQIDTRAAGPLAPP